MATCQICKYAGKPKDKYPCSDCKGYSKYEYEKQQTNADRIRAMSDDELANFMAERTVNEYTLQRLDKGHGLTAVQIEALKSNIYCALMQWLKQPAEDSL